MENRFAWRSQFNYYRALFPTYAAHCSPPPRLSCLVAPSLRAQSTDPGDLFVSAYMAVQAGDKAEAAGNFREANSKYRYAAQILNQISDKFPSWQPSIVDYRKKRTAEAVARIQEKVGRYGGAKGTTPPTMSDSAPPPAGADSEMLCRRPMSCPTRPRRPLGLPPAPRRTGVPLSRNCRRATPFRNSTNG
jgi:hypothetical protein